MLKDVPEGLKSFAGVLEELGIVPTQRISAGATYASIDDRAKDGDDGVVMGLKIGVIKRSAVNVFVGDVFPLEQVAIDLET